MEIDYLVEWSCIYYFQVNVPGLSGIILLKSYYHYQTRYHSATELTTEDGFSIDHRGGSGGGGGGEEGLLTVYCNHNLCTTENCNSCVPLQDMSWMNVWDFQKKNRER